MVRRSRRYLSPALKAKVVLTAVRGDRMLAELVRQFAVQPNQIQDWKKQLLTKAEHVFGASTADTATHEQMQQKLHAKIGQLTMENSFLERGLERIHGPRGKKW